MRNARTLFASAAVTAVIAVATPAAYAVTSADGWDKDSGSSSSSSNSNNDDREKPESWKHEKPAGGVDTGGGALAGIMAGSEKDDSGSSTGGNADRDKPESWNQEKSTEDEKKSESWKHEKPAGGVDTGGGALAGIAADDWEKDENGSSTGGDADPDKPESWNQEKSTEDEKKSESWNQEKSTEDEKKSESWKHEKPTGGVHTGGGAMALSGGSLAAGSVLMLGGLGVGVYRLRRRDASGTAAV